MRSAVVDLGSHSFHALVADVDAVGVRNVITDKKLATRLGHRAFAEGTVPPDACNRAHAALAEIIHHVGRRAHFVATGVFRDALNGRELVAELGALHHVGIEVLSGAAEARYAWLGVSAELAGSHGRLAVLDLGGGSLDCAVGRDDAALTHTLPLGIYRQIDRAVAIGIAGHALAEVRASHPDTVAVASGTARALLALARRMSLARDGQRHIARRVFAELARQLSAMTPKTIETLGVDPARCDTIATGAMMLDTALELVGSPVVYVARAAMREGLLVDAARRAVRRAA